ASHSEFMEMRDRGIGPALEPLHSIDLTHPGLLVRHHRPPAQKLTYLYPRQQPLLNQHLHARRPGQITELVVRALRKYKMKLSERVKQGKGIGDHRGIGIFTEENRGAIQEVMESLQEFRATVRRTQHRHGLAIEREPIVMVVLISPPQYA